MCLYLHLHSEHGASVFVASEDTNLILYHELYLFYNLGLYILYPSVSQIWIHVVIHHNAELVSEFYQNGIVFCIKYINMYVATPNIELLKSWLILYRSDCEKF